MHLKYAKMLAIVVHENMKLGEVKKKILTKYISEL